MHPVKQYKMHFNESFQIIFLGQQTGFKIRINLTCTNSMGPKIPSLVTVRLCAGFRQLNRSRGIKYLDLFLFAKFITKPGNTCKSHTVEQCVMGGIFTPTTIIITV